MLGRLCGINSFVFISAGDASIIIGDYVRIAPHVYIGAGNKGFDDPNKLILEQEKVGKGIVIEDDVWIGANCVILDGVCIGRGSVIGAGTVVTREIPPLSIAVGNPARVIRKRGEKAKAPLKEHGGDTATHVMSPAEELIAPGERKG